MASYPRFLTKCFWLGVADAVRRRVGRPRGIEASREALATRALGQLTASPGVKIVSLTVWSEGKVKCKEHHWHKVQASGEHVRAAAAVGAGYAHADFTCCRCTHGKCETETREIRR